MNQLKMFDKHDKIKIMHLNIRSIKTATKQTQLKELTIKHNPDIISLNETYLTDKSSLTIEGYNIIHADRTAKKRRRFSHLHQIKYFKELYLGNISGSDDACGIHTSVNRQFAIFLQST